MSSSQVVLPGLSCETLERKPELLPSAFYIPLDKSVLNVLVWWSCPLSTKHKLNAVKARLLKGLENKFYISVF